MKYTFDVNSDGVNTSIKLDISLNNVMSSASKTVTEVAGEEDYEMYFDELCQNVLDNMRFTVKERNEAEYNLKMFKSYLFYSLKNEYEKKYKADNHKEVMITENNVPNTKEESFELELE